MMNCVNGTELCFKRKKKTQPSSEKTPLEEWHHFNIISIKVFFLKLLWKKDCDGKSCVRKNG